MTHPKPIARRKPLRKVSPGQAKRMAEYRAKVRPWLREKFCAVFPWLDAEECHHQRGRVGPLLMDERYWIPVSRDGHYRINYSPEWARRTFAVLADPRKITLLCARGEWNTPDRSV